MKPRDPDSIPPGVEAHRRILHQVNKLGKRQDRTERKLTPSTPDEMITNDGNKLVITKKPGKDLTDPDAQLTALTFTGVADGTYTGEILSLTLTGDGETDVDFQVFISSIWITSGLGNGTYFVELFDGAVGSGTLKQSAPYRVPGLSQYIHPVVLPVRVSAWSGEKTFRVGVRNVTGVTSDFQVNAGAGYPAFLRATWAG